MAEWIKVYTLKLISYGHRLQDIGNYTLGQFVDFVDEVQSVEAQARIAFVIDVATAAGAIMGDGKGITKHLDTLQLIANGE